MHLLMDRVLLNFVEMSILVAGFGVGVATFALLLDVATSRFPAGFGTLGVATFALLLGAMFGLLLAALTAIFESGFGPAVAMFELLLTPAVGSVKIGLGVAVPE